jgi:hypothetical protein
MPTGIIMLGLAWVEASRSQYISECLEQSREQSSGRRRHRRVGPAQKHYVEKDCCFAIASEPAKRRVVVVNWNNHPILDITVQNENDPSNVQQQDDITVSSTPYSRSNKNRPRCERIHCRTLFEATKKLQEYLLSKENLVLIGHGLERILYDWNLSLRWTQQRCTATYPPYMEERRDPLSVLLLPAKLEDLMQRILKRRPSDNLLHQAAASLDLYKKAQLYWEEDLDRLLTQKEQSKCMKQEHQQKLRSIPEQQRPQEEAFTLLTEIPSTLDRAILPTVPLSDITTTGTDSDSVWETSVFPLDASLSTGDLSSWFSQVSTGDHSSSRFSQDDYSIEPEVVLNEQNDCDVGMGPLLPTQLLNDSSSSDGEGEDDENNDQGQSVVVAPYKREESSHPVMGDDWLESDTSPTKPLNKRGFWFSSSDDEGEDDENNDQGPSVVVAPYKPEESSHPVLGDDWLESDTSPTKPLPYNKRGFWFARHNSG